MKKDPNAVLDYSWDWSAWLADGETITTADVIAPTGLTVDSVAHDGTGVTAWLSGGTSGNQHRVVCRVVTSASRTDDRSITLVIEER